MYVVPLTESRLWQTANSESGRENLFVEKNINKKYIITKHNGWLPEEVISIKAGYVNTSNHVNNDRQTK